MAEDLAGRYRLIAELGQGGMAIVYLAVTVGASGFRKLAVVKLIRPQYANEPELIRMFLDEAKLSARLSHPNIVQTYDVGVDGDQHLMAMEYLDGVSLHAATARLTRDGGPFGFPLRARVLLEVLEALRYAHGLRDYDGTMLNIVHRDVTPHNIFITYDGQVKLLDFGIAKAATSTVQTETGVIKGKLTYMAPEQAKGETVDARSDLYAVGVMLWEAITGRRRWPAGLPDAAMFNRVAAGDMPPLPNAASFGYPPELDLIAMRAMAPKAEDRYQTALEFRDALEQAVRALSPPPLRELGEVLATACAMDRERVRKVIEEQFRFIDSGRPSPPANSLPTVRPPRPSDSRSDMFGPPEPRIPALPALGGERPSTATVTTQTSATMTHTPDAKPGTGSPRSRLVIAAAAGAGAIAIAMLVGARILPHAPSPIERAAAGDRPSANADAVPPGHADPSSTPSRSDAPHTAATGDALSPTDAGAPSNAPTAVHSISGGPPPSHRSLIGGTSSVATTTAPPVSTTTAAPPPTATKLTTTPDAPTPFHTPQTKPKVQLERDNPYP